MFKKVAAKPAERTEFTYLRSLFPKNVNVITLVVMTLTNGNLLPTRELTFANSHLDFARLLNGNVFAVKDGMPVIGPLVFRKRTRQEMEDGNGPYLPVGNVGSLFSLLTAKAA